MRQSLGSVSTETPFYEAKTGGVTSQGRNDFRENGGSLEIPDTVSENDKVVGFGGGRKCGQKGGWVGVVEVYAWAQGASEEVALALGKCEGGTYLWI